MSTRADRARANAPGRFHAFLLAAIVPLFAGAWLSDYAYWTTQQIEWSNFASWLLAGALVVGGLALLVGLIALLRGGRGVWLFVLLSITWITGLVDALVHARDAWAVMPTGLVLSTVVALLAAVSAGIAFATLRTGERS
jgi:uncharacterized membrane protein